MDHLLFSNMLYYFSVGHVDPTALKSLGQGDTKELHDDHEETKRNNEFQVSFCPITTNSDIVCYMLKGKHDTRNHYESCENERR